MAYQLTEENIKHATLSFLKTYYKNNSSRGFGDTVATLNMKTGDGIIADGYIKFSVDADPIANLSSEDAVDAILEDKFLQKKEVESFLATFEATSQRTAQEIQYRVQNSLLFFDALAIASIMAAVSYGYNYMNDQFTLNQLGTLKFFAGFFVVMVASAITYALIFRYLSRYHHIYALAQFKRYHADEQWVAYGEDVFANPDNKYLLELKKQCIRQGFGLILVDKDLQPSLVITPAREAKISTQKRIKNFVAEKTKGNKAFKWVDGIKMPNFKSPIDTTDYTRFTNSYWKQFFVILAMLFVMGEIYLEELKNPNIIYVDEKEYKNKLEEKTALNEAEPKEFLIETEDSIRYYETNDLTQKEEKKSPKAVVRPKKKQQKPLTSKPDALIISTGFETYISYDCRRLAAIKGLNYLVQIATANSATEAIRKVKNFNENGFKANAVWLGCFLNKKIYIVYLDDIFKNKSAAADRLERYQKLLIAKNQNPKSAVLRAVDGGR